MGYESPNSSEALGDSSGSRWMESFSWVPRLLRWRSHVYCHFGGPMCGQTQTSQDHITSYPHIISLNSRFPDHILI